MAGGCALGRYRLALCGVLLCVSAGALPGVQGGCADREPPTCCPGRNNECVEFSRRRTPCYCDTYCEKTGDCCEDYRQVCQISGQCPQPAPEHTYLQQQLHGFITNRNQLLKYKIYSNWRLKMRLHLIHYTLTDSTVQTIQTPLQTIHTAVQPLLTTSSTLHSLHIHCSQ